MSIPLAEQLRPQTLDDIVGQEHLLGEDKILRNIIKSGSIPNMIFYGPSGVGKTTISSIIANQTNKSIHKLNCTNASVIDVKNIIGEINTFNAINGILLYLDEIQYFNKKQQQSLLEFTENGDITLIASTTENPYFYIYNALLSRTTVFEFKSIKSSEIAKVVRRAFDFMSKQQGILINVDESIVSHISQSCSSDVRKAINAVELCVLATSTISNKKDITLDTAKELTQQSTMRYDRESDQHYDMLSAFQKSMRGSESNAAVYYLIRLLEVGDLASACRRLLVCACEDVGLAYPQIISIVKSCVDAALHIGMPEARIPLADAVIMVCLAPKSNSAYLAINKALDDIKQGKTFDVPRYLQNNHFDGKDNLNKGQFYKYPHDFKNHWVQQQYLPTELREASYYNPSCNKTEMSFAEYWKKIKD